MNAITQKSADEIAGRLFQADIPGVKIEANSDGTLTLEQDWSGNIERVSLHPVHVRYLAEQFGLIEAGDSKAAVTIATLQRRMTGLRERIDDLAEWIAKFSDHEHADLSHEMTLVAALADLAGEWCAEFEAPGALATEGRSAAE